MATLELDQMVLEHARSNRSTCRTCYQPIDKGVLRYAGPGLFGDLGGWHHATCAVQRFPEQMLVCLAHWSEASGTLEAKAEETRRRFGMGSHLDEVLPALASGDWDGVLTELARRWWATRDTRIAEVMANITAAYVRTQDLPKKGEAEAWVDARKEGMLARGAAMQGIGRMPKRAIDQRLAWGTVGPPDPRWLDLALPWLERLVTSGNTQALGRLLALVDRLDDERVRQFTRQHANGARNLPMLAPWIENRADPRPTETLGEQEIEILDQVIARASTAFAEEIDTDALWLASAGGDDSALAVLADALTRKGDVRGEFILLSLLEVPTRDQLRRRNALERTAWRDLVGDLEGAVLKRGLVFKRGLPWRVVVSSTPLVPNATGWASVEVVAGHASADVLGLPHAHRLGRIEGVHAFQLLDLLFNGPDNDRVREIGCGQPHGATNLPQGPCRLTALERIELTPEWSASFAANLRARLPEVEIVRGASEVGRPVSHDRRS